MNRIEKIRAALQALAPIELLIEDDSHLHAGHAGAATGLGHFRVEIRSAAFAGRSHLERHRMVYAAMGELMQTDVHALGIRARSAGE